MRLRGLALAALALAGCASTETVMLRNPVGQTVQCGPYQGSSGAISRLVIQQQLRDCVTDYQRQGYERAGG